MENSICKNTSTLREVLQAINEYPSGICFLTDEEEKLCGVVSDGDIRRLLLAGRELEDSLKPNDYGEFVYAQKEEKIETVFQKFNRKVRFIPIVDKNMKLINFYRFENRIQMPVAEPDLKGNEYKYLNDAFLSTWISSSGKYINTFEENFADFCETKYGVAVSNGTVALHLALQALNIGPGDEVILPDLTFAATINSVLHCGATPVVVDIDDESWCISPEKIREAITEKTKVIMPVHLYGQPCDMDEIINIANEHGLYVIEDAAESHGAEYKGKKVGSFGHISCFSFYANKIITTGEGGMCVTSDSTLDERMRVLRDHGMNKNKRYWHDYIGFNYRMTNLQAAIGCAQLERIDEIIEKRKSIEESYKTELANFDFLKWQKDFSDRKRVTWLVCSYTRPDYRELLTQELTRKGVDYRLFFYTLSSMPVYEKYVVSSGVSKQVSSSGFNLPTIRDINFKQVKEACYQAAQQFKSTSETE